MSVLNTLFKACLAALVLVLTMNLAARESISPKPTELSEAICHKSCEQNVITKTPFCEPVQPINNDSCKVTPTPKVLTSIKPLQLISQAITCGVSDTAVLLPAQASPHDYCLKFSDIEKLDAADLIFWVGPDMETFLSSVLKGSNHEKSIAMIHSYGVSQRKEQGDGPQKHSSCHHHHGDCDPHIWLSPKNALAMARVIKKKLRSVDTNKQNRAQYKANLLIFQRSILEADEKNKKLLESVKQKPFFVFHDAYGHMQDHYGLNIAGHFTINPQQQPGVRHLENLRKKLKNAGPTSVFREPQFQPSYINRLTEGMPVKVDVLDPLATDIAITPDGYVTFINSLINNIYNSLTRKP